MRASARIVLLVGLVILPGCEGETDDQAPAPPARPVLSLVVEPEGKRDLAFAGTVEPRYRTDRGFQVLGRILAYNVDIGDQVKRGDTLAQIDPTIFALDVRVREGDLARAQSDLANATAQEERTRRLVARQVSAQAELDADRQAKDAATGSVRQAGANLVKAKEQLGYTTLAADEDGVVTSKDADVGQTVAAGQKVMTIARTDIREAVVDLPESVTRSLKPGDPFEVRLQADPSIRVTAKVREIGPQADPLTRSRRVRITLDRVDEAFRLGVTITAMAPAGAAASAGTADSTLDIPRSAVLEGNGPARVWVVDEGSKTVRTVPVELAAGDDRDVAQVASGLSAGTRIVLVGVHSLVEGQAVKIDGETPR